MFGAIFPADRYGSQQGASILTCWNATV